MTFDRRARGEAIAVALAAAALLYALWAAPFLPTHDGPKQVYAAHVRFHVGDPAFRDAFSPTYPVTSLGFGLIYGVLERLLPWRIAYNLAWTLVVATLPAGVWQIGRAFDPRRAPLVLLGIAGAVHWSVHMGFANYVPSVGLGFLAIGIGIGAPSWSLRRELSIYALMLVICVFHPVGAQFSALGLFIYRALGAGKGRLIREIGAMVIGCAPAAAITIVSADTLENLRQQGLIRAEPWPLSLLQRLENFTMCFLSGPLWRSLPVLAAATIGFAYAVVRLVSVVRSTRSVRDAQSRATIALIVVALAMLSAALTLPMHSREWEFMQPRFIPPAVFGLLVLVPFERLGDRPRLAAIGTLALFAVASNVWVASRHLAFADEHREALSGFGAGTTAGRTFLPVIARPDISSTFQRDGSRPIPYAAFLFNVGQLYAVDRDAVTTYSFASLPNIHMIEGTPDSMIQRVPKRDYGDFFAPGADEAKRHEELVRLASFGVDFDDVMFYGSAQEVETFLDLGFEAEVRNGAFMLGHFVGCPLEISMEGSPSTGTLVLGWAPADRPVHLLRVEPEGPRTLRIERASCGPMWMWWVPDEGEGSCQGADDKALVAIPARAQKARCDVTANSARPRASP